MKVKNKHTNNFSQNHINLNQNLIITIVRSLYALTQLK